MSATGNTTTCTISNGAAEEIHTFAMCVCIIACMIYVGIISRFIALLICKKNFTCSTLGALTMMIIHVAAIFTGAEASMMIIMSADLLTTIAIATIIINAPVAHTIMAETTHLISPSA